MTPSTSIADLIERSSLGTPEARRHRRNTPPDVRMQILAELLPRARRSPSPVVPDDEPPAPTASEQPYFFLSHAPIPGTADTVRESDAILIELYRLLSRHIRHLTTIDPGTPPGYLGDERRSGSAWSAELASALATCRVFVPLYSPHCFVSDQCGREWGAFLQREASGSAIVPVLWMPVDPRKMPRCASDLDHMNPGLSRTYRSIGLYGLARTDKAEYRRTVLRIAQRIVDVAGTTRLRPCDPAVIVPTVNAFEDVW